MDETLIKAWSVLCGAIIEQAAKDIEKDLKNQKKPEIKLSTIKRHEREKKYAMDADRFLKSNYCKTLMDYHIWGKNITDVGLSLKIGTINKGF